MRWRATVARIEILFVIASRTVMRLGICVMILQSWFWFSTSFSCWMLNCAHIILIASLHICQLRKQWAAIFRAQRRTRKHFRRPILRLGKTLRQWKDILAKSNCFKQNLICLVVTIRQILALCFLREKLFDQRFYDWEAENLIAGRPVTRWNIKHELNNRCHLLAEVVRNPWVFALDNFLVKTLHIVRSEWRIESAHFVEDAAERPNVTLRIVGHVAPYFGACVIWRSCLRVTEALFDNLWHIEVAEFGLHVSVKENVGTLHVSVEDLAVVQSF